MDILIYLIPIALILSICGLVAFIWTLQNGQYDDLEGEARRILVDDEDQENDDEDVSSQNTP